MGVGSNKEKWELIVKHQGVFQRIENYWKKSTKAEEDSRQADLIE